MKPSFKKYIEYNYPYAFSVIACIVIYVLECNNILTEKVLENIFSDKVLPQIIIIESILFGFLLTGLSLIIQMDNPAINAIKKVSRYDDLISYCKSAIICSLIVVVLSLLAIILYPVKDIWYLTYPWWFSFFLSIFTLYRFVKIFFLLAKSVK